MRDNPQLDWTWLSWPLVITPLHPMDHTASGQASWQEKVYIYINKFMMNVISIDKEKEKSYPKTTRKIILLNREREKNITSDVQQVQTN